LYLQTFKRLGFGRRKRLSHFLFLICYRYFSLI
ncbi:hypothetical protein AVDCRST_MAG92-1109, partial [uncultured Coleofasciculus sp.]